ncbi:MAG: hypothetical protein KGH71_01980 [Candidatus Micrarchaeota archaeon]|nr:hypothetical protein [Candidatus Micrarchaeota archaeon]
MINKARIEESKRNVEVMNLAKRVVSESFADFLVENASDRLMNSGGNFTLQRAEPNNPIDLALKNAISSINFMLAFKELKIEDLAKTDPEFYTLIRTSVVR